MSVIVSSQKIILAIISPFCTPKHLAFSSVHTLPKSYIKSNIKSPCLYLSPRPRNFKEREEIAKLQVVRVQQVSLSLMMMGEQAPILPPGFRFHPTDEELVTYYLVNKVLDRNFSGGVITEVDLNKCEPWNLPEKAKVGEKEWYFFSLRDRKYPTGLRTNRATDSGYWKATGKDREICRSGTPSQLVGMKKTLVFYRGRAPKGEKSNWVMHEYRLDGKISYHHFCKSTKDEWVICRVYQKTSSSVPSSSSSCGKSTPAISAKDSLYMSRLPALVHNVQEEEHTREHVPCFSTDRETVVNLNPQLGSLQTQTESGELEREIELPNINPYQTCLGFNGGGLELGFPFGIGEIGGGGSGSNPCSAIGFYVENVGRASTVVHPSASSSSAMMMMMMRPGMVQQMKEYKVSDLQCFGFP